MSKKGVYKITGNSSPTVGEKTIYNIIDWYPDTPLQDRNPAKVTWELFKKRKNGIFTTTNIKKVGISSFTFGETAWKNTYRLEAYLHKPEKKEPMSMIITPKPNKIPKINKVELHYVDDTKGSIFSFMEKLRAKAHAVNLLGKDLVFTLWEDDAKNSGHNVKNMAIETQKAKVGRNGVATVDFMLTKALMQKALKGETDAKQLEFYVTVEYYKNKKHETENVNINNPFPQSQKPKTPTASAPTSQKPKSKNLPKAKGSPAEQKPPSKKEEKGIVDTVSDWLGELWDHVESKGSATKDKEPAKPKIEGKSTSGVGNTSTEKKEETECFCKKQENQFYWSNKLTCEGRKKVLQVCANLWGEDKKKQKASELMAIMHVETAATFNPAIDNGADYSGLIQFSDASAKRVGTTRAKLKAMTFVEQMDYVEKYLKDKKDQLNTMTDLYLMVLKTNAVGQGSNPNYVLFDESVSVPNVPFDKNNLTKEPWVTKYGYASNPTYMVEKGEYENKRQFQTYSRGVKEKRGFAGGKTYVWEVTDVLTKKHYNLGKPEIFNAKCENIKEEPKKKSTGKRAPWMEVVMEEAKNYGGFDEGDNPLKSRIKNEYFSIPNEFTTKDTDPTSISWCAAFASWCLNKAGYSNPSTCRALEFNPDYKHDGASKPDRPSGMRKVEKPTYGCVIVWKNSKGGGGHTAFHYGYESNGNIVPIGGNQGSSLKFSSRSPNGDYGQKIVGYFLPKNYEDNNEDEFTKDELSLDPKKLNKSALLKKSNEQISGKTT